MADMSQKEKIAEHEIASALSRRGLLIAKPFFDQRGADLLAFSHICGGAKFARVQSKYRQEEGKIQIASSYVPGAFVCILYLVPAAPSVGDPPPFKLYCFFPDDIRQWSLVDGNYTLHLPKYDTCTNRFASSEINDAVYDKLVAFIRDSKVQDEMGILDFSNPNNSSLIALILSLFVALTTC